ncbi:hypothetical protein F5Y15DRAFT_428846 [Xylariaceae sp. FL0016]|nr:hypothetical protein F5Y15DRAFT_428846 [Xylariaceae sp. FL0016]
MSSYDLKGGFAIVTGAGSGISHALTEYLLEAGASVMLADLRLRPEAEATVQKYPHPPQTAGAPSAIYQPTDTGDWSQLSALFAAALRAFGRVDIVVNGAGIYEPPSSTFWHAPGVSPLAIDDPDARIGQYQTFAVNTTGPIRLAQIAIDYWLENREVAGSLLWLASVGGYVHSMQSPMYFASKAAIVSFVRSLAALRKMLGIRNSALCPGATYTPIFHPEYCRDRIRPDDMTMTPQECAAVAMRILQEPQYGDGSILEAMKIGSREDSSINVREVPLEALYPTMGPVGQDNHLLEEEEKFVHKLQTKGMRRWSEA